jgi:hypothetical protein
VETAADRWRRCSSCKAPIAFEAGYWTCNVSTCNRPRTGLVFCSVSCWDAHLAVVNHRQSWAVERRAPSRAEWAREGSAERSTADAAAPAPASAGGAPPPPAGSGSGTGRSAPTGTTPRRILPPPAPRKPDPLEQEVLVVLSKLKAYVRARAGMNTSDRVAGPLSDALRELADRAIEKARAEGRKTLLDRDFE